MKTARLSIVILGSEGCANEAIGAANIIVTDIDIGLDLLLYPLRCKGRLRF